MAVNRGKQFEEVIKQAFEKSEDVSFDRFPDPMAGYAGIRNICDFVVYQNPFQYYIECKAFSGNTLNFASNITKDQWKGLEEKSMIPGVAAGIIVWFIEHDITSFVPIQQLIFLKNELGAKSLNVKHLTENQIQHFPIAGRKKRVLYEYQVEPFLKHLRTWVMEYWQTRLSFTGVR